MTIEEIFTKIATHMVEGLMFHDQVCMCYDFIGIRRFAKEHRKHYMEESECYRSLLHYYSTHYHKLLKVENIPNPKIVPDSWYKYTTNDVDIATKRNAIRELSEKWVKWEKDTKQLYQEMYCEATSIKEVAAALYIEELIKDVSKELKKAEQLFIDLESIGYDMPTILTGW